MNADPQASLPAGLVLLRALPLPRKLGLLERLYGRRLASKGRIDACLANGCLWTIDCGEVTHRWMLYGDYEGPAQMHWLRRWLDQGGVLVDSGANIGQFIVSCSGTPGLRTFAFEPASDQRHWLERCLRRYPEWDVCVVPMGLGAHEHTAWLKLCGGRSTLRQDWYRGRQLDQEMIHLTTLDQFALREGLDRIHLWKLDMEGYEPMALAGAQTLLAERRIDAMLIETQSSTVFTIEAILSQAGYVLHRLQRSGHLLRINASECAPGFEGNVIALPPSSSRS